MATDQKTMDWGYESENSDEEPLEIDYDSDAVSEPDDSEFTIPRPSLEEGFDRFVICDGLPKVDDTKLEKLKGVLKKLYKQIGLVVSIDMPKDDSTGKTYGFALIEFEKSKHAGLAVDKTNNYRLDKKHILKVNLFSQLDQLLDVPDTYVVPEKPEYVEQENLRSWLLDEKARNQYVCRYQDMTDVYVHDQSSPDPVLVKATEGWSQSFVQWSNQGMLLATVHPRGVRLWGGPSWLEICRFEHDDVQLISFSQCDKYLVTFSPRCPEQLIVWEVRSGKKMRAFSGIPVDSAPSWPYFHFSHDDQYFARSFENSLFIYDTSTFKHIPNFQGKKSPFNIPSINECAWSPSANILAFTQPEQNNKPAKVTLLNVKTLKEVRQKNLFNVASCHLHWQSDGKYLAVKVDRLTKTKKPSHTDFEVFCCDTKDVPVQVCEIKDEVTAFAWEPKGDRFAIIHGKVAGSQNVSFYKLTGGDRPKLELVETKTDRPVNHLFWSPAGKLLLMAGLGKSVESGVLEFWDADSVEMLGEAEHYLVTDIAWDPSGQFVATSVSHWQHQFENGFMIFNFFGRAVHRFQKDKFFQFLWRPLPPTLLAPEDIKVMKKNLKKWSTVFEEEDRRLRDAQSIELDKERQLMLEEFENLLKERRDEWQAETDERRALRGGFASDDEDDWEEIETTEDFQLNQIVEEA